MDRKCTCNDGWKFVNGWITESDECASEWMGGGALMDACVSMDMDG